LVAMRWANFMEESAKIGILFQICHNLTKLGMQGKGSHEHKSLFGRY